MKVYIKKFLKSLSVKDFLYYSYWIISRITIIVLLGMLGIAIITPILKHIPDIAIEIINNIKSLIFLIPEFIGIIDYSRVLILLVIYNMIIKILEVKKVVKDINN